MTSHGPSVDACQYRDSSFAQPILERLFAAPVALVYACHTEPDHLKKWLQGPGGWKLTSAEMDVRTGGTYVWNYTGPDGGTMTLNGEYVEVDAPNRIVHRENWGPDLPSPLVEVTFADADGSTLMTVTFTFADNGFGYEGDIH